VRHESVWSESLKQSSCPALEANVSVDVAIIGAGVTGITAALLLKQAGKKVALIEMHRIAAGETGHTTAHLTAALDVRYQDLERSFGAEGARLAAESSTAAIQQIADLVRLGKLDCGFALVPAFLYSEHSDDLHTLEQEVAAMELAGLKARMVKSVPLPFPVRCALALDGQAQIDPGAYLLPLAATIPGRGSYVFENTQVTGIEEGEPCRVTTAGGVITSESILVTANVPISNLILIHTKLAAYRTYAIAAVVKNPPPAGLYWDLAEPYHYTRTHELGGQTLLLVGGEDHKTGEEPDANERWARLKVYTKERYQVESFKYAWSGQIIEPADRLPYIGLNSVSSHTYVATGYSGNGMTFGTLAGMLLSDAVLGRKNRWAELFDATRIKPLAAAERYLSENADVAVRMIGDRLAGGEDQLLSDVKPGEGKLVEIDGETVAVYRNNTGACTTLSPVCPHLAGIVNWNNAEATWDCPCHGSRFDRFGKVLNGPAMSDLSEAQVAVGPTTVTDEAPVLAQELKQAGNG
jgi:glycine/D-amino acid oxidase-like deaminating enzyme/nitrite reductase/ring-hydroxylating ferredoxin subunit